MPERKGPVLWRETWTRIYLLERKSYWTLCSGRNCNTKNMLARTGLLMKGLIRVVRVVISFFSFLIGKHFIVISTPFSKLHRFKVCSRSEDRINSDSFLFSVSFWYKVQKFKSFSFRLQLSSTQIQFTKSPVIFEHEIEDIPMTFITIFVLLL